MAKSPSDIPAGSLSPAFDGPAKGQDVPAPTADEESQVARNRNVPEERREQASFAIGAFNTLRAREIIYISEPITSGRRLYTFMDAHGYKTIEQAKKDADFFKDVVGPNLAEGNRIADLWAQRAKGVVIATTDFEKSVRASGKSPDWGQDDFMSMWMALVDKKVTKMVMVDGWEYSNGSGEEYLQAALMEMGDRSRNNIAVIDEDGKPVHFDKALQLLAASFDDVRGRGMDVTNMAETLSRFIEAERRYAAEPANANPKLHYDHKKFHEIAAKVTETLDRDFPAVQDIVRKTPAQEFSPIDDIFRKPAPPKP